MEIPTVFVKSRKFACETCMTLHETEQEAFSCCEAQDDIPVEEVSLQTQTADISASQEVLHTSVTTELSPSAYNANLKKTKWSRELFSLFLDEVELRYPSLRDRSAKKINIWKDICSALNIHNPELTHDQVHQKWRNIVAAVRKYEESLQLGERGRKVRPLFYERIKIILGESVPNSLQHDLSPKTGYQKVSRDPNRAPQGMKRKFQTQKIANVLETLARVWNADGSQDYEVEGMADSDSDNGEVRPLKKNHYDSGTHSGRSVKLYDIPGKSKVSNGNPNAGVYVYDFKSEWHNTLPFIKRGPTVHQFWCDICKVMDFCDFQGNDGIRWHVQSLAHQEKAKELQKPAKPASKTAQGGKTPVQVETKVVDVKKLEKMVLAKPEIADRAIIISVDVKTQPRNDTEMVKDILSVVGEDRVEEIDVITKSLILLTLKPGSETVLDSIRMIKYYDVFEMVEIHYTLHFLHPIEANIEGMLTGLPRLISSSELLCIEEHIGKYMPHLSDISMEYVPWAGTSLMSGNLKVKAAVTDIVSTYTDLKKTSYIYMAEFMGKLNFENFEVISKNESLSLPVVQRSGVSLHKW